MTDWRKNSGVIECHECEGNGGRMRFMFGHANDPDNWFVDCADCGGDGYHPCEVCGNDVLVSGYDCIVCDMVGEIPDKMITPEIEGKIKTAVEGHFATRAKLIEKNAA